MSIQGRGSRKPVRTGNYGKGGVTAIPIRTVSSYTETEMQLKNATPHNSIKSDIIGGIEQPTTTPLQVSNHPTMASGVIVPLFLGTPGNPTQEFIYSNPYIFDNNLFFMEENKECEKVFLFANVVANRRDTGFLTKKPTSDKIPYSPTETTLPNDSTKTHQIVFVEQNVFDDKFIQVSGLNLMMRSYGEGVTVLHTEELFIDTWYNGKFNNYNIGNNVGIGYTNDTRQNWSHGDRYKWSFGTLWFTYNISTRIDRNIDGTAKNCNLRSYFIDGSLHSPQADIPSDVKEGKEIKAEYSEDIKLIAWKFNVDNVLDEKDIYNPDNIIGWETDTIPSGNAKWEVHLTTDIASEYSSGGAYVGEISGALYNDYYKNNTFYKDHPEFVDVGWYSRNETSWYSKVYGKALYKNYIRSLVSGKCFSITINEAGNFVLDVMEDCCKCCDSPS